MTVNDQDAPFAWGDENKIDHFSTENLFIPDADSQVRLVFFRRAEGKEVIFADKAIDLRQFLIPAHRWENIEQEKATFDKETKFMVNSIGGIPGECRANLTFEIDTFVLQKTVGFMTLEGYVFRIPLVTRQHETAEKSIFAKNLEKTTSILAVNVPKILSGSKDQFFINEAASAIVDSHILLSHQLERSDINWGKGFFYPTIDALIEVQLGLIQLATEMLHITGTLQNGKLAEQMADNLRRILDRDELEIPSLTVHTSDQKTLIEQSEVAERFLTLLEGLVALITKLIQHPNLPDKRRSLVGFLLAYVLLRFEPIKLKMMELLSRDTFHGQCVPRGLINKEWINNFFDYFTTKSTKFAQTRSRFSGIANEFAKILIAQRAQIICPLALELVKNLEKKYQVFDEFDLLESPSFQSAYRGFVTELIDRKIQASQPLVIDCLLAYCLNSHMSTQILFRLLESTK